MDVTERPGLHHVSLEVFSHPFRQEIVRELQTFFGAAAVRTTESGRAALVEREGPADDVLRVMRRFVETAPEPPRSRSPPLAADAAALAGLRAYALWSTKLCGRPPGRDASRRLARLLCPSPYRWSHRVPAVQFVPRVATAALQMCRLRLLDESFAPTSYLQWMRLWRVPQPRSLSWRSTAIRFGIRSSPLSFLRALPDGVAVIDVRQLPAALLPRRLR